MHKNHWWICSKGETPGRFNGTKSNVYLKQHHRFEPKLVRLKGFQFLADVMGHACFENF